MATSCFSRSSLQGPYPPSLQVESSAIRRCSIDILKYTRRCIVTVDIKIFDCYSDCLRCVRTNLELQLNVLPPLRRAVPFHCVSTALMSCMPAFLVLQTQHLKRFYQLMSMCQEMRLEQQVRAFSEAYYLSLSTKAPSAVCTSEIASFAFLTAMFSPLICEVIRLEIARPAGIVSCIINALTSG